MPSYANKHAIYLFKTQNTDEVPFTSNKLDSLKNLTHN